MVWGISWQKLLLIRFWFAAHVNPLSRGFLIATTVVLSVIFLTGLIFAISSHVSSFSLNRRRVYRRWYHLLATFSLVGEFFILFRQYNVDLLGARFWWLVLCAGSVWWGYRIVQYAKQQERLIEQARSHEQYSKYLPKKT